MDANTTTKNNFIILVFFCQFKLLRKINKRSPVSGITQPERENMLYFEHLLHFAHIIIAVIEITMLVINNWPF